MAAPSFQEFMPAARAANPGVPDADLANYWRSTYPDAVDHSLPTLEGFIAKAKPANPNVPEADLKDYWQQTYGIQGADEKEPTTNVSDYVKSLASGAASGAGMIFQGGGELLARAVNATAGTHLRAENPLQPAIDWLESSKSAGAKELEAGSQIGGEITQPSTWSWGTNPTIRGIALQGMNAIGQIAPNLGLALATGGLSAPAQALIGGVVGGVQALGGSLDQEREAINAMSPEDLQANSELYRTLIAKGTDPATAKNAVAEAAAIGGGLGNAIPSAGEWAFETFLVRLLTSGKLPIPAAIGSGMVGKAVTGVAGGAALGGVEEAVEQAGQNIGSNLAIGGNRPIGADTLQQFVMGAIGQGVPGAGFGAVSHIMEKVSPPQPMVGPTTEPLPTQAAEAATAQTKIAAIDRAPNVDAAIAQAQDAVDTVSVTGAVKNAAQFAMEGRQVLEAMEKQQQEEAAYQQRDQRLADLDAEKAAIQEDERTRIWRDQLAKMVESGQGNGPIAQALRTQLDLQEKQNALPEQSPGESGLRGLLGTGNEGQGAAVGLGNSGPEAPAAVQAPAIARPDLQGNEAVAPLATPATVPNVGTGMPNLGNVPPAVPQAATAVQITPPLTVFGKPITEQTDQALRTIATNGAAALQQAARDEIQRRQAPIAGVQVSPSEIVPSAAVQTPGIEERIERRRPEASLLRKSVSEMSPEEMRQALLVDHLTGLGNRRAYDESAKLPTQVSIDIDSLKFVNDHLGHAAGDELIRAVGTAIANETQHGHHISGDEFVIQAQDGASADAIMARVRSTLEQVRISATLPNGETITKRGIGVSYGKGATLNEAESGLRADKARRTTIGERSARGEEPTGVARTLATRDETARGFAGTTQPSAERPYAAIPLKELQRIARGAEGEQLTAAENELNLRAEEHAKQREERLTAAREARQKPANVPHPFAAPKRPETPGLKEAADAAEAALKGKPLYSRAPIFYSELSRQIGKASMNAAPAKAWQDYLRGLVTKGVKADEIQWSGITDWLDLQQGKVTKEQVQDYLKQNGVKVEEVQLKGSSEFNYIGNEWQQAIDRAEADGDYALAERINRAWEGVSEETGSTAGQPKFASYQLPGGENYRELALTLPGPERYRAPSAHSMGEQADVNRLAHIRFNEHTDAEGKKVLFIEEIQSDWAQKGKKEGFQGKQNLPEWLARADFVQESNGRWSYVLPDGSGQTGYPSRDSAHAAAAQNLNQRTAIGVPAAPFVGNTSAWVSLALKRMIRYAAENGFDRIAWATGTQQADRYDLSKQVEKVFYRPAESGGFDLRAARVGETGIHDIASGVPAERIADYVGKDLAEKIGRGEGAEAKGKGWREFSGVDLKVGGEGMRAFYDKIVAGTARDVLRRLSVGAHSLGAQFKSAQVIGDRALADAKAIRDLALSKSFVDEGFEGLSSEAKGLVQAHMLALGENDKVLKAIVGAIPVDVVNMLSRQKLTPEMFFHDPAMLVDHGSINLGSDMPTRGDVASALISAVARVAAKGESAGVGARSPGALKENAAVGAGAESHVHEINIPGLGSQPGFDITPAMRSKAMEGLPLFSETGRRKSDYLYNVLDKTGKTLAGGLNYEQAKYANLTRFENEGVLQPIGALSTAQVEKVIAAPLARLKNIPQVQVVQEATDIPGVTAAQVSSEGGEIEGAYVDGKLYLVASSLKTAARAREVLAHEAIGHLSVEQMLEQAKPGLMDELTKQVQTLDKAANPYIRDLAGTVDERQPGLNPEDRAKEIIALVAERGDQGETMGVVRSIWKKIVDAIKSFYKLTFGKDLNDQDVRDIVGLAERWAQGENHVTEVINGVMQTRALLSRASDVTQTAAFKRWFGDSKVVDENAKPLVVYHTSTFGNFSTFDKAEQRKGIGGFGFYFTDKTGSAIYADYGMNFQASHDYAGNQKQVNTMPVYLKINNPLRVGDIRDVWIKYGEAQPGSFGVSREVAKVAAAAKLNIERAGYDGIIAVEYVEKKRNGSYSIVSPLDAGAIAHPVYVVFDPEQIKSAIGNRGTFDANNPNILFSRAPKASLDSARNLFEDMTKSDRVLNRMISKFNTPFHIAETQPAFKPVYDEAQASNQTVSSVANAAADQAPDLLPRIDSIADFKKKTASKEDMNAVADAVYAGTLFGGGSPMEGRVWTDDELKTARAIDKNGVSIPTDFKPLTDAQIKLYRQNLASVAQSLTDHSKALIWRLADQQDFAVERSFSLEDLAQQAKEQADAKISDLKAALALRDDKRENMMKEGEEAQTAKEAQDDADRTQKQIDELTSFKDSVDDIVAKTNGLIDHGYSPLMRFGKYGVNVQDTEGKELFFGRYETQMAANMAARKLKDEFKNGIVRTGVMPDESYKLFQGLNLDALQMFAEHMTDDEGKPISADPIMQEFFRVATAERSNLKRQIHRKGTPGFSRDIARALAQFTVSTATSTARTYHGAAMLSKVRDIKAGDLQNYAARYVRYLQDPQEESHALRGFLANYYILGSLAFGAVNMTQPVLITAPYLTQYTSYAHAMSELAKAGLDMVRGRKSLTADEENAYKKAAEAGVVSPQEIHQIRADSQASAFGDSPLWQKLESVLEEKGIKLPGKLALRKAAFLWGSIYSLTEQFNRGSTFLAAYRIAKQNNIPSAYDFASKAVAGTQFTYNRANRMEASRGPIGSVILTFKSFNISYLELAKRLYTNDKKAFAVLMLTLFAMAGAQGLPFAEDAEDLIDTIGQWMGYGTNSKKKVRQFAQDLLGKDISNFMLYGTSAIPGVPIDISNRMGMHNIIPGTAMLKTSEPDKTRDILDILGPAATLFQNVGKATQGFATGQPSAAKLLLPLSFQNIAKGTEMLETGQYKDQSGRKVMDVDAMDAMFKGIGFQPSKVAAESRIVQQNQQDITLQKTIEASIADNWAHGLVNHDPQAVEKAREQLQQWNRDNPEMRIALNSGQINRRIRELQMSRQERFVRSASPEVRQAVRSDLRP